MGGWPLLGWFGAAAVAPLIMLKLVADELCQTTMKLERLSKAGRHRQKGCGSARDEQVALTATVVGMTPAVGGGDDGEHGRATPRRS